jgi:hypothetical protein
MGEKSSSEVNNSLSNRQVQWGSLMAFLGAIVLLVGPLLKTSDQKAHEEAILQAQSVAYQAWELEKRKAQSAASENRSPSSVSILDSDLQGSLGSDSTGAPYKYKIRREGLVRFVDIWTEGPNSIKTQVMIPDAVH